MSKQKWTLIFSLGICILIAVAGCVQTAPVAPTSVSNEPTALEVQTANPAKEITSETSPAAPTIEKATATRISAVKKTIVSFVDIGRNLYVWDPDTSSLKKLVGSGDVIQSYVSPDGSMIAFTRSNDHTAYQLDVIKSDGTDQKTLVDTASFNALQTSNDSFGVAPNHVAWIPGTHLLAMSIRILFQGPGLQIGNAFYTIDADSGAITPEINVRDNFDFSISPNGKLLTISRPNAIDLYQIDGSLIKANVVSYETINTASEYNWVADPAWQNDSTGFTAAIPPKEPWVESPSDSTVWKVTSKGEAINSFNGQMGFFPTQIASFSPSLTQMAFAVRVGKAADNQWALHLSGIDGSNDSILDQGYFSRLPVWSPDGNAFIYAKLAGSKTEAYLVLGGAAPGRLDQVVSMDDIRWLDNTHYLISSNEGDKSLLMLGTLGANVGIIYRETGGNPQQQISFDVNT